MEAQLMLILSGRFIGFSGPLRSNGKKKSLRAVKPKTYRFSSLHNIAYRERCRPAPDPRLPESLPDTRLFRKKVS
jgi:hypothetical protein